MRFVVFHAIWLWFMASSRFLCVFFHLCIHAFVFLFCVIFFWFCVKMRHCPSTLACFVFEGCKTAVLRHTPKLRILCHVPVQCARHNTELGPISVCSVRHRGELACFCEFFTCDLLTSLVMCVFREFPQQRKTAGDFTSCYWFTKEAAVVWSSICSRFSETKPCSLGTSGLEEEKATLSVLEFYSCGKRFCAWFRVKHKRLHFRLRHWNSFPFVLLFALITLYAFVFTTGFVVVGDFNCFSRESAKYALGQFVCQGLPFAHLCCWSSHIHLSKSFFATKLWPFYCTEFSPLNWWKW